MLALQNMVMRQREFYQTGATRSESFRIDALQKLKTAIREYEEDINASMKSDLNKTVFETYLSEIGNVLEEISYHQKHLRRWMKPRRVKASLAQFPGRCVKWPEPYGTTLIMAPWNYPFHLCLMPLIGAISGGNTAVVKPSIYAPASSHMIARLISATFPPKYITVVEGGREQNAALLQQRFDYIFFTGSPAVGTVVMEAAAKHLTPLTLELGGKSPVIVDQTADISLAAKKIAFGKVLNAGQTCIAPDYLLIHESVKDEFVREWDKAIATFFPEGDWSEMATIVTEKHYARIRGYFERGNLLRGGEREDARRLIAPALIDQVTLEDPIMQEEIFGPVLPVLSYQSMEECIAYIHALEKPLAFYLFSNDKTVQKRLLNACSFGGGCVNDVIMHIANPRLPFGGVGHSGMGSYHGKSSFRTFTHERSLLKQRAKADNPLRYMPYTERNLKIIRKVLK